MSGCETNRHPAIPAGRLAVVKRLLLFVALLLAGCGGAVGDSAAGLVLGESSVPAAEPFATKFHPTEPPDVVFDLPVKLTNRTASVARNTRASVTIKTTKGAECGIDVQYPSGSSTAAALVPKIANSKGVLTWKWLVGRNASKGKVPIVITCTLGDRSGRLDTSFKVK
jgi:hypothetical protein